MANEVNTKRSKLMGDMLHIEFLDGNSYLYSLQEIADIIAAEQSVHPTPLTLFGMRVELANWLKPNQWFIRPSRRG